MITSLWIGVLAVIFHVLAYLLILRVPLKTGYLNRQIIQGAMIYLIAITVCLAMVYGFSFWQFSAVYYFGCVVYFFITSVIYTSVSVKTLYLLINQSNQSLPSDDIYRRCILSSFEERAELFVKDGLSENVGNLYVITQVGRTNVQWLRWIRKLFGVETTGFYS